MINTDSKNPTSYDGMFQVRTVNTSQFYCYQQSFGGNPWFSRFYVMAIGKQQWGYNNTTGSATITFPIAFSVACYSVAIGGYLSATGNVIAQQITKTSFKLTGPSPGDAQYARWLAIGN